MNSRNWTKKNGAKNIHLELNKNLIFYFGVVLMMIFSFFLLEDDIKIPQREVSFKVSIEDKVNICHPEEGFLKEESFFHF